MRMRAALIVLVACAAGCSGARHATTTVRVPTHAAAPAGLRVGVVGPLDVRVSGASVTHVSLDRTGANRLVVVSADAAPLTSVAAAATAHPQTHYVLVGATTRGERRPNLAGLVLRDDQAAFLGGVVGALVAADAGGTPRRIAWVGPEEAPLTAAYARGAHSIDPAIGILRASSQDTPAACKEAALAAVERGAAVVMAHGGLCADAAVAGAHQQNHVGLQLADFELPDAVAAQIVREAVGGVFHGGEDIVFGASSGAIGVSRLDPRISATEAIAARTAAQDVASGLRPSR
jgi:basic membrane lipoprotein Med (substrate-binding protein (PBP1-ABC) superfamily)